ncbi:conserved exported hypothetical protein [Bradyrhizobium sp. STM 3843]|uniref:transglutaminase-like cysteine peptidase n=1 Tax=Bradyrhizobium sp. STM 3843 TaxID=551947 RepID=UPI000240AEDF|nr:transglutaminase-like cysteine peptidase [Bradyrhizobium sp. STM 3843]CCE05642.1 conserved exported hypothetical protein [Bradyrhizobium sp. STM 3843]
MTILGRARAPVAAFVTMLVWAFGTANLFAGPIGQPVGLAEAADFGFEPFGLGKADISAGPLQDKWLKLVHQLADDQVQLALCDGDREHCVSPAALRFLAIVDQGRTRDGRARLGEINRAINLAIKPVSDLAEYGEEDVWNSPIETFARGAGDCEDYAIAKYVALRLAGIDSDDLRIVIMRDTLRGEDHAVAAARLDGHWLMLDNQRMAMVEDTDARNVRPLFVIDEGGIAKYTDVPMLAQAQLPDTAAPALLPDTLAAWD